MKKKIALISGVTGQDGSYLAEFLLKKKYIVHGIKRRSSTINTQRIDHLFQEFNNKSNFILHHGDMTDNSSLQSIVLKIQPDEIYNLAAQSHVQVSFEQPEYTANADAIGTLRFLEIIKNSKKSIKFYQASTSELFGKVQKIPQDEKTPFYPRSPYGTAKLYSYWMVRNYREAYNLFACNGILFNHESPRRGETFVTRKITIGLSKIKLGIKKCLYLGNLEAKRDWGHAKDFVEAQWKILQQKKADDYVIATGKQHSVREFVEIAAKFLDISIKWEGKGLNEKGYDQHGKCIIRVHSRYFRPNEVDTLLGNYSKAKKKLRWKPQITFKNLVKEMTLSDLEKVRRKEI